ncbi:MAG TPA: hypothetical protein VD735_06575 [Candidatus Saccharimonadales bacterium]|nr:hypothetical protein [Candidatus Saccharimonadales bacterium]
MTEAAALIACAILAGLTIFQILLIAGKPLGHFAWGGAHRVLPPKLRKASVVSIVLYALFAVLILSKAGVADIIPSQHITSIGMWVSTGYFLLGIPLNAISRSRNERLTMTPVVTALAIAFLIVTLQ